MRREWLVLVVLVVEGCGKHSPSPAPYVTVSPPQVRADGYSTAIISIRGVGAPRITSDNPRGATIEEISGGGYQWQARVRAGILPGRVRFRIALPGAIPTSAELEAILDGRDALEDGTPDFLRLDDEHDRQVFRRWFTYLAEAQYFQRPEARPAEIDDCAALIRYAYREALHAHDSGWSAASALPVVPAFDSVAKYRYPYTPLGAALFRVRPGSFHSSDLADGTFAQFADAQTLWRLNCHFVSRQLAAAMPGDLLFFRRESGQERFHSMIYLGTSQIRKDSERYVVYHTGSGEMRRLSTGELMRFPQPEWRPVASNPGFLGVYRWNILCSSVTN